MDTWLRQVFIPALPETVRVILASREPPVWAWLASPGWQGLFRTLPLGPLGDEDALELLARSGRGRQGTPELVGERRWAHQPSRYRATEPELV